MGQDRDDTVLIPFTASVRDDVTMALRPLAMQVSHLAMLLVVLMTAGCAAYRPVNVPLSRWNPDYGYRPARTQAVRPMGNVLLVLAFSGGGTRAA